MTQEQKEWTNAVRRSHITSTGGIHIYIDSETLSSALKQAGIPLNAKLKVKRHPLKSKNGIAKIKIEIMER